MERAPERLRAWIHGVPRGARGPRRPRGKIVDLNSAHHYKEHGDQIRAWWAGKGYW